MVKADVKHNYYADLELPSTASLEDVRKAYRKLALQYHPDRNAGKEEECVPKFQAIQSAIEILGEPENKQKYDADRKRAGINPLGQTFNPRQAGPGNPYGVNTAYPPPPRRTTPGTWQRPTPNGADRFSSFPRPAPTAKNDPAQNRTDQFKAWEKMQPRPGHQSRPQSFVPPQQQPSPQMHRQRPQPPPRQDTRFPSEEQMKAGMRTNNVPPFNHAEKHKSAWEAFNQANLNKPGVARNTPGTTPRRQGFNPNMPGSDEKPADAHYFHRKHSADFGRDQSGVKVPPPPSGPPPGSDPTSPVSPTSRRPYLDPTKPFSSSTPNDQVPFAEGNRDRTPYGPSYASYIRERTDLGDGLRRSYSTRDTTKLGPEDAANRSRARSTSPLRRQRASESHAQAEAKNKAFDLGYSSGESSGNATPSVDGTNGSDASERPNTAPNTSRRFDRPKKTPTPPSSRFNGTRDGATPPPPVPPMPKSNGAAGGLQADGRKPSMQQNSNSSIFNFPHDPNMFTQTNTKSRSEENINTQFTSEPWKGAFGETDFAPPPPSGRKSSPVRRTTRTSKDQSRAATMDVPPTSAPAEEFAQRPWGSDGRPRENPPSAASTDGIGEDHWEKNPFSWQHPSRDRSGSPANSGHTGQTRKQSQGRRTSKAANRGTSAPRSTQEPHVIDEDDTIEVQGADGAPEHGAPVLDEPEPMDIDNTPPAQNGGAQQSQNEARLYNVPRSRRQEQEQKQASAQGQRKTSSAARKPVPGSDLNTNLDDLRHVEPIGKGTTGGGGLFDLRDVTANLPVQSQAASKIIRPNKLNMPPVPKAPAEPPTTLTKALWFVYAQNFAAYVTAFHDFNKAIIEHFAAREQSMDANFKHPLRWLEATGDTSGVHAPANGFVSYCALLQEDEQVREHWNVACDRHAEAMKAFGKVRERVRRLVEGGGLADV